jgi:glycosyltransferase involved in cell wall biosynthesis
VTFLGGFVESNAIDVMIGAAQELQRRGRDDLRIALIGSGTDKEAWVQRAAAAGVRNVIFPPPVPKARIADAMAGADAFIGGVRELPLYRLGLSLNKLPDYLASGRPVVFFGHPSYDPVRESGAGLSVRADPIAVADALERLADATAGERAAMGARGRRFVEEHHSVPQLAERYLAAISATA